MESAQPRLTSGHTGAHLAGDKSQALPALDAHKTGGKADDPQTGHAAGSGNAVNPGQAEGADGAKNAGRKGGMNRFAIASYTKYKGIPGDDRSGNGEQGIRPVPVPPQQLIGANLDVRA